MEKRENIQDRLRFISERDIIVPTPEGDFLIESKSRNLEFGSDPLSFPYSMPFVDTRSGWDQKEEKPRAVVFVSPKTREMLVVSVEHTRASWTTEERFDHVRKIKDTFYVVPKEKLVSFDTLVKFLRRVSGKG